MSVSFLKAIILMIALAFLPSCQTSRNDTYPDPQATLTTDRNSTEIRNLVTTVGSESLAGIKSLVKSAAPDSIIVDRIDDAILVNKGLNAQPLHYTSTDDHPANYVVDQLLKGESVHSSNVLAIPKESFWSKIKRYFWILAVTLGGFLTFFIFKRLQPIYKNWKIKDVF